MDYDDVYRLVKTIPRGKVTTYKAITEKLASKSSRWIGNALHHNPDNEQIPCHRVVKATGELPTGYAFGGRKEQKQKLVAEGVKFKDKKQLFVDLENYFFDFQA